MTGRVISQVFPKIRIGRATVPGESALTTRIGSVKDFSLKLRAGEIVGVAGLVGCGKSEVGRACIGLERIASGRVIFDGQDVTGRSVRAMLDRVRLSSTRPPRGRIGYDAERARERIAAVAVDRPFSGLASSIAAVSGRRFGIWRAG